MKRGQPLRRTPLKRGKGLRPKSDRAAQILADRRRRMREHFGPRPDCWGEGILPTCPRRPHRADTSHEPGKRSQGADPADPAQAIPVCDDGHRWIHDHPAAASGLSARDGRPFLILPG